MKNHVVLIIVLFLLVLVTANCTSSNNSELLYIDEKGIIHIEIEKILDNNCNIYKQGKNWYCEVDNIIITVNSYSYTIITVHTKK